MYPVQWVHIICTVYIIMYSWVHVLCTHIEYLFSGGCDPALFFPGCIHVDDDGGCSDLCDTSQGLCRSVQAFSFYLHRR